MFLKTAIILAAFAGSYIFLVFGATTWLAAAIGAVVFAESIALSGLNIMHDGNHGSYCSRRWMNRVAGQIYELLGGSTFVWRFQHNHLHHNYTNIEGKDNDIHTGGLLRLTPNQDWRRWHRWQHLYAVPLYGLMTLGLLYGDTYQFIAGCLGHHKLPERRAADVVTFVSMRLIYVGYMLVIPALLHPLSHVLIVFLAVHLIVGSSVTMVFSIAHVVEGTRFATADRDIRSADLWAVDQVESTANFATENRLLTWCLGGLNHQIEHHLCRQVCHVHYPDIKHIIRETCEEFGVRYLQFDTLSGAVLAHLRFLRALGRNPEAS